MVHMSFWSSWPTHIGLKKVEKALEHKDKEPQTVLGLYDIGFYMAFLKRLGWPFHKIMVRLLLLGKEGVRVLG